MTTVSRNLLWFGLIIVILHTALILQWSARQGRLALPVYYDDNHSLVDGAHRLEIWQHQGGLAVLKDYKNHPPHAPGHSAIAAASFALLGFHAWAPYLTNALFVGLVLLALHLALGCTDWRLQASCILLVTCAPIAGLTILEFRSEVNVAALGALGVMLFLNYSISPSRSFSRLLESAACFASCFLIKPPVFPYTLGLMGLCMIYHLRDVASFKNSRSMALRLRDLVFFGLLAVLPALPHYILDWAHITSYIHQNAFSSSSIWLRHEDFIYGLLFHITGYPGRIMLGHCQLPVSLFIAAAMLIRLLRPEHWPKDLPLISVLYFTTGAFLGVAVNPMNQNYFGMTFHWLFLISGAVALVGIIRTLLPMYIKSSVVVLTLFGGGLFFAFKLPPSIDFYREKAGWDSSVFNWLKSSPDSVLDVLRKENRNHGSTHVLVTATTMINGRTLEWYSLINRDPFLFRDFFGESLQALNNDLLWSDLVVVPEKGTPSIETILPSAALAPEVVSFLDSNPSFVLIQKISSPNGGPGFRIYARRLGSETRNP